VFGITLSGSGKSSLFELLAWQAIDIYCKLDVYWFYSALHPQTVARNNGTRRGAYLPVSEGSSTTPFRGGRFAIYQEINTPKGEINPDPLSEFNWENRFLTGSGKFDGFERTAETPLGFPGRFGSIQI
jgi:hypothetical protein